MTIKYRVAIGTDYLDPHAVLSENGYDAMTDAYIAELQRYADETFGDGAVEIVGVEETVSAGNRNYADDDAEQAVIDDLDAYAPRALEIVANQPWETRAPHPWRSDDRRPHPPARTGGR